MKFFNFIAGFFQDQSSGSENGASRKAAAMYFLCCCFWTLVNAASKGVTIEPIAWYCVSGLLAWTLGAITTEYIVKYLEKRAAILSAPKDITDQTTQSSDKA